MLLADMIDSDAFIIICTDALIKFGGQISFRTDEWILQLGLLVPELAATASQAVAVAPMR